MNFAQIESQVCFKILILDRKCFVVEIMDTNRFEIATEITGSESIRFLFVISFEDCL